jgi:mono/diheme cytochrome c family protein
MQLSRSFSLSLSLLALPLAIACGGEDDGNNAMPTTTTTSVTPTNPPVTPSTTAVTPTNPPVTPSTTAVTPTNPPVTPTNPPVTPEPAPTDTWAAVYPIMQTKCSGTFCHAASQFAPQLVGDESVVKPLAEGRVDKIAMRTAADAASPMPPAGAPTLTNEERAAIQAWTATF